MVNTAALARIAKTIAKNPRTVFGERYVALASASAARFISGIAIRILPQRHPTVRITAVISGACAGHRAGHRPRDEIPRRSRRFVRLTALSLTCAAKAHVSKPCGAAAAAHAAGRQRVICSRRDTTTLVFGRGASAPDRSRAATGSAMSWAARIHEVSATRARENRSDLGH